MKAVHFWECCEGLLVSDVTKRREQWTPSALQNYENKPIYKSVITNAFETIIIIQLYNHINVVAVH